MHTETTNNLFVENSSNKQPSLDGIFCCIDGNLKLMWWTIYVLIRIQIKCCLKKC